MKVYIMKNIKLIILLLFIFFIIISCIKPSEDIKEINLINLIKDFLDKLNEIKDNPEEELKFYKNLMTDYQAILAFYKNTEIFIKSSEAIPNKNDFMYTLDNNKFITIKPIYITFKKKESIYSLDNKTWYLNESDPIKEIEGIKNDYYFNTKITDNYLYINYSMSFGVGRAPKIMKSVKNKKIVTLKKGMVFASYIKENETNDLSKEILYIPANTILSGKLNIDGNIVNTKLNNDNFCIKSLQDIFIYIKKKLFSLSFDKKKWNINILSFDINPKFEVKVIEDNHIFFDISVSVNHLKDDISFSIIKLLLQNM